MLLLTESCDRSDSDALCRENEAQSRHHEGNKSSRYWALYRAGCREYRALERIEQAIIRKTRK